MAGTPNTVTCTLRLAEALKARLENSASNRNISLNQHVLDIIEQYYRAAGFVDGCGIQANGRSLELHVKPVSAHPPGLPMCFFFLDDPSRNKEVACYSFGFSSRFMRQLRIEESQQYNVISEIGLALIHYFNRNGQDITRLEWNQYPTISNRRILQFQDAKTRTDDDIHSVEQFLSALQDGLWSDRLVSVHSKANLDARAIDAALVVFQQSKEIRMDRVIEFEPSKRFIKIEEAIREAFEKAKKEKCTVRFDCNDLVMFIDATSDINSLIDKYWEFRHNEGIANGSIVSASFPFPI
ncbi:MAG: hypothetical protein WCT03_03905 [Candidatus Obscuribacterales bacterium]|jgi:hypothetical protein